jgi:hypothetical protein
MLLDTGRKKYSSGKENKIGFFLLDRNQFGVFVTRSDAITNW